MSSLKIKRNSEWANSMYSFQIVLDGKVLDDIEDGEIKEFLIPPGKHTLQVKLDWCASRPLHFNINEGEKKLVEIKGFIFSDWFLPVALFNAFLYFFLYIVYDINSIYLAFLMFLFLGYLLYFVTFGKSDYLRIIEHN